MHTRILLFEDSDLDAGVIEAAIRDNSDRYTLERVYRLEDGLRSLSEQDCDCILLDLNLPDSKGLGTLRRIRAETLEPIIVLTLGTDVEMAMDALKNGAQDFIPKEELKPSLLLRTLSYTLQRRQAQQELEETFAALEAARADAIQKAEELEEEKEILEAVINNLVEGVLVADEDGEIVHINSTARRLQNIGESDGKMEESVGLLDPETHSALDEENLPFARALRGDTTTQELLVKNGNFPNGAYVQTSSIRIERPKSKPIGVVVWRDLTHSRRAEEVLEESVTLNRSIIDRIADGLILADEGGEVLFFNPAANELLGERLVDTAKLAANSPSLLDGEPMETEIYRSDGLRAVIEIKVSQMDWFGQSALLASVREITERKMMEVQLREGRDQIEQSLRDLREAQERQIGQERLSALGQMASGIAHDFNNALAPIMGFSELLLKIPENLENREKTIKYLKSIHTAANDGSEIVARLREFYRPLEEDEQFLPLSLQAIVNQAIELTQPKWKDQAMASGRTINIHTDFRPTPLVEGIESEIREVLTNLIFNAVDAMSDGGSISLSTRPEKEAVLLEVSDTGDGMAEDVRQKCLEPFFSTKGEAGSGLGLAMVFGIIDRHGGSIDIHSELGKGTSILIRLPIYEKGSQKSKISATIPAIRSLRILVVEDEDRVREILVEYLRSDGHSVVTASNGIEGLDAFRKGQFDLVVTDRSMPKMSGDQMAVSIKRMVDKPIIMLTGFGLFMGSVEERPAGVDYVLSKPIKLKTLREAVRCAMESSHTEGSPGQ